MKDGYTRLTRAILESRVASTSATTALFDIWVIVNGILRYSLTNNGPQSVSKVFAAVTTHKGILHLITTTHYPQCRTMKLLYLTLLQLWRNAYSTSYTCNVWNFLSYEHGRCGRHEDDDY